MFMLTTGESTVGTEALATTKSYLARPRSRSDLRLRRDVFEPRMLGFAARERRRRGLERYCRICGCSEEDPCAGGCGWSRIGSDEKPLCTACAEFRDELEAFVEDGRVTLGGVVRLYREVRAMFRARREAPETPHLARRAAAGGL